MIEMCQQVYNEVTTNPDDFGEELTKLIKELTDLEVDLPSSMKQRLVAVRLRGILTGMECDDELQERVQELVAALDPFPRKIERDDGDDKLPIVSFNPLCPHIGGLDGGMQSKLHLFVTTFCNDVLPVLLHKGEDATIATKAIVSAVLELVEDQLDTMDDVHPLVEQLLDICRAIVSLLDPTILDPECDAVATLAAAGKKAGTSVTSTVALNMMGSSFYKELVDDFMRAAPNLRTTLPALVGMVDQLSRIERTFDAPAIEHVKHCLKSLPTMKVMLRKGATYTTEAKVQKWLELFGRMAVQGGMTNELVQAFGDCLHLALQEWPTSSSLQELKKWTEVNIREQQHDAILQDLRRSMEACTADTGFDLAQLATVRKALDKCTGLKEVPTRQEPLTTFMTDLLQTLFSDFPSGREHLAIFNDLAKLSTSPQLEHLNPFAQCLSLMHDLLLLTEGYKKLGDCIEARVKADESSRQAKEILRVMHALDELFNASPTAKSELELHSKVSSAYTDAKVELANIQAASLEVGRSALYSIVQEQGRVAGGGVDGELWYCEVPAGANIEAVIKAATKSIMATDAAKFLRGADEINQKLVAYTTVVGMFDATGDEHLLANAKSVMERLCITNYEGLLCSLFDTVMDRQAVKVKVHGIQKALRKREIDWEQVMPVLKVRAANAIRLK